MSGAPTGVLLMSYGTPAAPEELESYYTDIRGGRPPTPELLAALAGRYQAIGGMSPLAEATRAQAVGLQRRLDGDRLGRYLVRSGTRHARPSIEEAVGSLRGEGVRSAVALVLAPHYSELSVGAYHARARAAAEGAPGLRLATVESWHLEPGLTDLLGRRIKEALERLPATSREKAEVLVTAHSLPARVLDTGDPYPAQVRSTARAAAAAAGVTRWRCAWQSAGRTPEAWLGPDLLSVVREVAARGASGVVVCPAGFTSDHLEVLYDVDVEAARVAAEAGIPLVRTASLNDDPELLATLATVVGRAAARLEG